MNSGARLFILFIFIFNLMFTTEAGAVPGQSYRSDSAINNPTVPPGGWIISPVNSACLGCHTGAVGPDKTSYLNTGHKNALRKVLTTPTPLTGPTGTAYGSDLSDNALNWSNNTITISGFCTNILFADQAGCIGGGGVWISGIKTLYYLVNGWMGDSVKPSALFDGRYTQGTQKTAVSYSCARCHTTGFKMESEATITTGRPPESSFPGITWTPNRTNGKINFDPDGDGPAVAGSWAIGNSRTLEGVECERCHNYALHSSPAIVPRGASATVLCVQCHRQEHTLAYAGAGLGSNIKPTPYSDNIPALPSADTVYPLPSIEVGSGSGYAPQFYGYSTGMEFLNSVHSKFTGTFGQIGDSTKYTSGFKSAFCNLDGYLAFDQLACEPAGGAWTDTYGCKFDQANCVANFDGIGNPGIWTVLQGTCTTCHDVHVSTVAAVNAAMPFTNKCPDCHTTESNMAGIKHPQGTGTPLGDLTNIPAACVKCHMPKPNNGAGYTSHIWRINTSATYTTFPTATAWNTGQKTAYTASSGTYTNAVWIDIDLACGQCHNGSGPAQHYFSKTALAAKASGMHAGSPWSTNCLNCHTSGGDPSAPQVSQGTDHHTGACETCHTQPGRSQFDGTNASCLTCHSTSPAGTSLQSVIQGTNHHTGTCTACHAEPGVATLTTANASCSSCHAESIARLNHPSAIGTPAGCATCHTEPGVPVSTIGVQSVCGPCHGGSSSTTHNGAPYRTAAELSVLAQDMHRSKPTAGFTWSKDLSTNYRVTYNASSTVCPAAATCSYTWSTGETGKTASHTFAGAATTSVTLTVNASPFGTTGSYTLSVTPEFVNSAPIATDTSTFSLDGYTATYADHSSGGSGNLTVKVTWGDGKTSIMSSGTATTHLYTRARTYNVKATVFDMGLDGTHRKTLTDATVSKALTVAPLSISGTITDNSGNRLQGVVMTLEQVTALKTYIRKKAVTNALGVYTFQNVIPNAATGAATSGTDYTVAPSKNGYTFTSAITTVTNASVSVNIAAN